MNPSPLPWSDAATVHPQRTIRNPQRSQGRYLLTRSGLIVPRRGVIDYPSRSNSPRLSRLPLLGDQESPHNTRLASADGRSIKATLLAYPASDEIAFRRRTDGRVFMVSLPYSAGRIRPLPDNSLSLNPDGSNRIPQTPVFPLTILFAALGAGVIMNAF